MGKLLRKGWEFHLAHGEGEECYAMTPGGAHRVEVELGMDEILRINHTMRADKERIPLPVHTVKRSAPDATATFLHDCFTHRGDEKIFRTLGVTKGFIQKRFQTGHCDACAQARAR